MKIDLNLGTSVGVAVRDLDPVVDLYQDGFGLGPFGIEEVEAPTAHYCDGNSSAPRPAPAKWRAAVSMT